MNRLSAVAFSSLLLFSVGLGCSSSSTPQSDTTTPDTTASDMNTPDTTASDMTETDTTVSDMTGTDEGAGDVVEPSDVTTATPVFAPSVAAVKMEKDAAEVCAEAYKTTAMVDGQNGDYAAGGQTRSFYLKLPNADLYPGPRPLFVGLHGTNGTGLDFYDSRVLETFVDMGIIVLAPDGNENGTIWPVWDALRNPDDMGTPNPDMDFLDSLIYCVAAHYEVDENRIYLGGHSAGGIMANYVLQRRSYLYAGGIVGSGVFDLTSPIPAVPLDPMAVIVTWGGTNDSWAGQAGEGPSSGISFPEQSFFTSKFYEETEGINHIYCEGGEVGHKWLIDINTWMMTFLLHHPKGLTVNEDYVFETPESADGNVCDEGIPNYVSPIVVECAPTDNTACDAYCQLLGDCVVENGTAAGVLSNELVELGFTGDDLSECSGCSETCAADVVAGGATDESVVQCIETAAVAIECTGGLEGAITTATTVNTCCDGQTESKICERLCVEVLTNEVVMNMNLFTSCLQWQTTDPGTDP